MTNDNVYFHPLLLCAQQAVTSIPRGIRGKPGGTCTSIKKPSLYFLFVCLFSSHCNKLYRTLKKLLTEPWLLCTVSPLVFNVLLCKFTWSSTITAQQTVPQTVLAFLTKTTYRMELTDKRYWGWMLILIWECKENLTYWPIYTPFTAIIPQIWLTNTYPEMGNWCRMSFSVTINFIVQKDIQTVLNWASNYYQLS